MPHDAAVQFPLGVIFSDVDAETLAREEPAALAAGSLPWDVYLRRLLPIRSSLPAHRSRSPDRDPAGEGLKRS